MKKPPTRFPGYACRFPVLLLCGAALFIWAFAPETDHPNDSVAGATEYPFSREPLRFSVSNPENPGEQHVVLEYYQGDPASPLVFIAPHSGTVAPSFMPDRKAGFQPTEEDNPFNNDKSLVVSRDCGSDLVALETAERIARQSGARMTMELQEGRQGHYDLIWGTMGDFSTESMNEQLEE